MSARERTVWSLPGQAGFAAVVGRALGCPVHVGEPAPPCDVVHVVGMYDCPTFAETLRSTEQAGRRVYHWMGPDAANRFWPERIPDGLHLCPSEAVRDLLHARGVHAKVLPLPTTIHAPVTPFGGARVVAVYGGVDPREYGLSMVGALRECLPGVRFLTYGRGQFDEAGMARVLDGARVYLRLRRVADGALSSREYLAAGRRVVSTDDLPYGVRVAADDLPGVLESVEAAVAQREPDHEAAAFWTARNTDASFAEEMGRML